MLRTLRSRRRPHYGAHLCAAVSALLLLLSVTVLYSRLGFDVQEPNTNTLSKDYALDGNPFLEDAIPDSTSEDRIDELDIVEEDQGGYDAASKASNEEEILRGVEMEDGDEADQSRVSGFYFDHVVGVIRRHFDKRSVDKWEDDASFDVGSSTEDLSKGAFASDDVPVDAEVRQKVLEVNGIEDALLLKRNGRDNPLREGWGVWFDKKSDFLRRDRMFKSNLDLLNPLNNPMLQDPDAVGVTGLTRGDKIVQKFLMNEFKKVPFLAKQQHSPDSKTRDVSMGFKNSGVNAEVKEFKNDVEKGANVVKRAKRRTLDDKASQTETVNDNPTLHYESSSSYEKLSDFSVAGGRQSKVQASLFADGKRWGYFHDLHPHLSFSDFMDTFLRKNNCHMRVFMIWNSPPWMYMVRQQRGLESLLLHHPDACVVVFSETVELDFLKDFVKDGYKVAVAMPNLDELLKDTPVHIFSSVWFEWRKTKYYPTHYSELVRLAALYKYGGTYLDSDIIVLNPLSSLTNSVGLEDHFAGASLSGAVMAFRKHSPFILECLNEFHSTYDDTRLRWNGADLLTRVSRNFSDKTNISEQFIELQVLPSFTFFPINRGNITRYFSRPASDSERAQEDVYFSKILNESLTFHFWNSLTSALVPEPESLVARLIDRSCIRCSDIL